jgi:hypothetical protein
MAQSALLTSVYADYLIWLEMGAPKHEVFTRSGGLCPIIISYCNAVGASADEGLMCSMEFQQQLEKAKLSRIYPFNMDELGYIGETTTQTCHLNPQRLQWIKERVNG